MLASLIAMLAVLTVRSRFDDPDMWWHLKMGQVIWTTHAIPRTDLFSWTTNHHAYIPHEWLSQASISAAYSWAGYSGLMLWLSLLSAALLVMGYILCSLYSGNAKVGFLGALTIWLFATVGFSIRPQLIGYLLLIVELIVLQLGRTRDSRWFFLLPPVFAIWVNCHGSFPLGIIVAALVLFSSYFDFQRGSAAPIIWEPNSRRILMLALILSLGALFVNPIGVKLVFYPVKIMFSSPLNLSVVDEWRPLRLNDARGVAFLLVIGFVCVRRLELYSHEILIMILAAVEAANHERLIFAFGVLAAPIVCRLLSSSSDRGFVKQDHPLANGILIVSSLLVAFLAFPNSQNLVTQVGLGSPVKAVKFIESHHLVGPMLNDYTSGGYLIWVTPEYPVFVDGRTDIFEWTGVLDEYGKWATLQSPPTSLLNKYQIGFCLLPREAPMAVVLPLLQDWKDVYSDDKYVIFIRTSVVNAGHVSGAT
jgi:hypothetical protein